MTFVMKEQGASTGRFSSDARRRELVRELMRARRAAGERPLGPKDPEKASTLAGVKSGGAA